MFLDIMVPVIAPGPTLAELEVALAFMRGKSAHLDVVRLVELPAPIAGAWSLQEDPRLAEMHDELRSAAAKDVERLEERLKRSGVSHTVRMLECHQLAVEEAAALEGRYADVVIVGGSEGGRSGQGLAVAVMLKSGRPVIFVPPGVPPALPPRHVVLAWKPTLEAARAVHDALHLLKGAEAVDVVMIDAKDSADGDGASGDRLLAHLGRHGVRAKVVHLESRGASLGTVLQRHAEAVGAQLIVSGGYGHSRLREWVMGGATRDLLLGPGVPVLFSH